MQTACLQHCITTCHSAGGGATIVFPPGTFHTGSLSLPSHTTLQLAAGATILGSIDPRDYPLVAALPSYGISRDCCCNDWLKYNCTGGGGALRHMSLLSSTHADDVTVIGAGPDSIIDGTHSPTPRSTPPSAEEHGGQAMAGPGGTASRASAWMPAALTSSNPCSPPTSASSPCG